MAKSNPAGHVYLMGDIDDKPNVDENVAFRAITSMLDIHKKLRLTIPITLFLSTYGGDVSMTWTIFSVIDRIRREGRKVNGHVLGAAQSGGFYILQHCDQRIAESSSSFMVHEFQSSATGSTSDLTKLIAHNRRLEKQQFELWSRRTGKPLAYYIEKNAGHDWMMLPHEVLDEKLLDVIIPGPKFPKLIPPVKVVKT
jgi:ATP-dependent protease ClpP protease subunit